MKNDFFAGHLDETVFVNGGHKQIGLTPLPNPDPAAPQAQGETVEVKFSMMCFGSQVTLTA